MKDRERKEGVGGRGRGRREGEGGREGGPSTCTCTCSGRHPFLPSIVATAERVVGGMAVAPLQVREEVADTTHHSTTGDTHNTHCL